MLAGFVWLLIFREMAISRKADENEAMKAALSYDGPSEKK